MSWFIVSCNIKTVKKKFLDKSKCLLRILYLFLLVDTHDLLPVATKGKQTKKKTSKGESKSNKKTGNKSSSDPDSTLAAIGGRDTSLFLFRALGKILYCKSKVFF